jgi:hypothetical protein
MNAIPKNLIVIELDHKGPRGAEFYKCKCHCGNEVILKKSDLLRRKSCGCVSGDENFFSVPNILNSYWAGFIAADGCIRGYHDHYLSLGLSKKDISHLEKFKRDLRLSNKITIYDKHNSCITGLSSNKICDDLKNNFNITPRKSKTLKPPNIKNKTNILSFIAGYIDGDGSVGKIGPYRYAAPKKC